MAQVLVVDDMHDVADSFAELLTLFGHSVRVAYSGSEALLALELRVPDVALIDINMPDVDGFQLAREIRQRWGADIRLVAHTAYPREAIVQEVAASGFDSFVSKSARPLELALALQGREGAADLRVRARDRRRTNRPGSSRRRDVRPIPAAHTRG
jgi:CheY-like chemotaxis protein